MKKIPHVLPVLAKLILLFCGPEKFRAGSSILDPPPPASSTRITPPDISGVNLDVNLSEGHEGEIPPPAGFLQQVSRFRFRGRWKPRPTKSWNKQIGMIFQN
jgi:hypothetical protein